MKKKFLAVILGGAMLTASALSLAGCGHKHNYEVFYQHSDCDSEGFTLHTCTDCGYQYADEFTAPLGHAWRSYYHIEENYVKEARSCSLTRDGGSSQYSLFTSVDEDALRQLMAMQYDLTICKHEKCEFCNDPKFLFYDSGLINIPKEHIDFDNMINEMTYYQKQGTTNERVILNIPSLEKRNGIENVPKITIRAGEFDAILGQITGRFTINIPDSVIHIEAGAFRSCIGLDRVKLSNNLKYIDAYAFNGARLPYVVIPKSVEYIGDTAFGMCISSMMAVYYCGTEEEWNKITFENPNDPLKYIKVYFYNENSTTEGKYWRYNGDGEPWHDIKITYVKNQMKP